MIEDNNRRIKKKLLIAVDNFFPKRDGVIVFLEKVVPSLSDEFDITVVAPAFQRESRFENINVTLLDVSKTWKVSGYHGIKFSYKNFKKIKHAVKDSDIVFVQDLALIGLAAIHYGKRFKKPVYCFVHQIFWEQVADILPIPNFTKRPMRWIIRHAVRHFYNKCDYLIVPYPKLIDDFNQKGITSKKIVVPLGVSVSTYKPPHDKSDAKKRVKLNPNHTIIGYCGRISREKDLITLRKAFSKLKKKYRDLYLLIVGGGIKSEVDKLGKARGVMITGFVKNPLPFYQAMDIFVLPSLTETTSLATLEAMSVGLPVVVTKVGYIKDYIRHRVNGVFFPKHNSYHLAKRIEWLLEDKSLAHSLGVNARKTVSSKFSWGHTVYKLKKAFRS